MRSCFGLGQIFVRVVESSSRVVLHAFAPFARASTMLSLLLLMSSRRGEASLLEKVVVVRRKDCYRDDRSAPRRRQPCR